VSAVLAAALTAGAVAWLAMRPPPPLLDLSRSPQTLFTTIPMNVGASYTFGSTHLPDAVKRPVTITAVEVVRKRGLEVVGIGAVETSDVGIGLVPGWPPPGRPVVDPVAGKRPWSGGVDVLIGLRIVEPTSGLRGIEVRWIDGDGVAGSHVYDLAAITCSPGACTIGPDQGEAFLRELGLLK
jgi:hypothetical protein